MKSTRLVLLSLTLPCLGLRAQNAVGPDGGAAARAPIGETSIALDIGFGIRFVPPSRVTIPTGEKLRITAPFAGSGFTYIWTRNGRALPGVTSDVLTIDYVTANDAGTYACQFSTPTGLARPLQQLILGVGPTDRYLNLSSRGFVGGGTGQEFVAGFVVVAGSAGKKSIVRVIGPSLALFGVPTPLRQPVLRILDARGQPYANGYAYPAVVGGPTYESDLADSLARVGAFPLPADTRDVVLLLPLLPGSYTAQITSGDGSPGTALFEIYEVP